MATADDDDDDIVDSITPSIAGPVATGDTLDAGPSDPAQGPSPVPCAPIVPCVSSTRLAPHYTHDFVELPDGTIIWHASLILLHYLSDPRRAGALRGKRVLELGSGIGDLGYGIAMLGAHVTCTDRGKCVGELAARLQLLEQTKGPTANAGGSLRVMELEWGEDNFGKCELAREIGDGPPPFDVIISSELVYIEETHELLIWCFERLSRPDTIIWSIFINRPFSWNFFALLDDTGNFECDQIDDGDGPDNFDACGLEEVHMHRFTPKAR